MIARAVALAALLAAAPAWAINGTVTAEPTDRYGTTEVTIAQGDGLVFANHDLNRHDVTADGDRAAFHSPLVGTAAQAPVDGVGSLLPGPYGFHCSLHAFMTGRLLVTGVGLRVLTTRLASARQRIRLRVGVWPAAAVTVRARLAGHALPPTSRQLAGAAEVVVAVPAGVRRALAGAHRARLAVTVAAAGATAHASRQLG